jgi:uncharacterized membrane protein YgdD (TMEM256/DUF423 family)
MEKKWIITGICCIILAVLLGAFGAHGLQKLTQDPKILASFDTATKYQFFQGLGCILVPMIAQRFSWTGSYYYSLFLLGTSLFSGSIYVLCLAKIGSIDWLKYSMVPLTPIGGVLMILAWTLILIRVVKSNAIK